MSSVVLDFWNPLSFLLPPTFTASDGTVWATAAQATERDEWLALLPELTKPSRIQEMLDEFDLSYEELAALAGNVSGRHLRYVAAGRRTFTEALVLKLYPALIREDNRRKAWRTPRCLTGLVQ